MSAKWMGYFLDEATDLADTELLLAIAIADHADGTGVAWPGYPLLAHKIRKKLRHTKNLVKTLESKGYVEVRRGFGRGQRTVFQLKKVQCGAPILGDEKGAEKGAPNAPETVQLSASKGATASASSYIDEPLEPIRQNRGEGSLPAAIDSRWKMPQEDRFVRILVELTGHRPDPIIVSDLIKAVGNDPDEGRLVECFKVWRKNGFRADNFAWVTDWYNNGCRYGLAPYRHGSAGDGRWRDPLTGLGIDEFER